ncbi:hypothetical protein [Phormidium sp. CCY1219]|uniref:hypothetical protein n=1 Tax=Phormidium sp. CCY1219 TaxID=2886104 RepID=UPI002D1EEFEB|nr:hypothetical protein [Phormidium sp. CCY1219]MEB3829800.1 hypothetical protein [Phormidium sp. CCY1219]
MQEPIQVLVNFAQMLTAKPPFFSAAEVQDLPELKDKLIFLAPTEVNRAAEEIHQWCDRHPQAIEDYHNFTAQLNRLDDTPANKPSAEDGTQSRLIKFAIQCIQNTVLIQPQIKTFGAPPRKKPILDYIINSIDKKMMELSQ